jgi:phage shock protein A
MAYIFDSLGYAKRLREGGVPQEQAEAHAEATRDFIMVELATKADLLATKQELRSNIDELRSSIGELRTELRGSIAELRTNIAELRNNIDTQSLRLTVRLGAMLAVGIGALAALLKLA